MVRTLRNHKPFVAALIIGCVGGLNACAVNSTRAQDGVEQQAAALQRWTHCLERFSAQYDGSALAIDRAVNIYCDGHRRDVVTAFPEYLENHINSLLSQQTGELAISGFAKVGTAKTWTFPQDTHLDTFRTRLTEARDADL